jgi:polyisoprenyl-phosphate glycosyltransferase
MQLKKYLVRKSTLASNQGFISVGVVVSSMSEAHYLSAHLATLENSGVGTEIVVVSNGLSVNENQQLGKMIEEYEDATLHVLSEAVNEEFSYLIVIDHCIGVKILLIKINELEISEYSSLLDGLAEGCDFSLVRAVEKKKENMVYRALRRVFLSLYSSIAGVHLDTNLCISRAMSREGAQYLLTRRDAEMSFKFKDFGLAYPVHTSVTNNKLLQDKAINKGLRLSFSKAYHRLNKASAMPIRGVVGLSMLSALVNFLYALYIISSYLLKEDTAPGWTTLSLQISGMFFIFSIILAIMGEVLISIDRGTNHRLRYVVQREIRSKKTSIRRLRNLEVIADDQKKQ